MWVSGGFRVIGSSFYVSSRFQQHSNCWLAVAGLFVVAHRIGILTIPKSDGTGKGSDAEERGKCDAWR